MDDKTQRTSIRFDAEVGSHGDVIPTAVMERAIRDYIARGGGVSLEGEPRERRGDPVGFIRDVQVQDDDLLVCGVTVYDPTVKARLAEMIQNAPTSMCVYPVVVKSRYDNAPDRITAVSIGLKGSSRATDRSEG